MLNIEIKVIKINLRSYYLLLCYNITSEFIKSLFNNKCLRSTNQRKLSYVTLIRKILYIYLSTIGTGTEVFSFTFLDHIFFKDLSFFEHNYLHIQLYGEIFQLILLSILF